MKTRHQIYIFTFLLIASNGLSAAEEELSKETRELSLEGQESKEKIEKLNAELFQAVEQNNPERVRSLLDLNADPNCKYEDKGPALLRAARLDYSELAQILVGAGADVNATCCLPCRTPLYWAYINGNLEIADLLKTKGGECKLDEMDRICIAYSVPKERKVWIKKGFFEIKNILFVRARIDQASKNLTPQS